MSNAAINAHIMLGEPCGENATLDEIADWAGELIMADINKEIPLKHRITELCKIAQRLLHESKLSSEMDWLGIENPWDQMRTEIRRATEDIKKLFSLKELEREYWLMDGRAFYDIDKAIIYEVCYDLNEAYSHIFEYGADTCIIDAKEQQIVAFMQSNKKIIFTKGECSKRLYYRYETI